MAVSLRSTVARLEAENAALRATSKPAGIPSIPMCRAILKLCPALQRRECITRTGNRWATSFEVEVWLEQLREAIGLA